MSVWTERTARKDYRCTFCAAPIQSGDRYASIRLTPWDHPVNETFFTWRAHPFCRDVWDGHLSPLYEGEWDEGAWDSFRGDAARIAPDADYPWTGAMEGDR